MNAGSKMVKWFRRIAVLLGIVASIAAVISLYFQVRKAKPGLEAAIINAEHVTAIPKVTGLEVNLNFHTKKIDDFWIVRARIRNTGDVTIVGQGTSKNILRDAITLGVPEDFEILDIQPESPPVKPGNVGFQCSVQTVNAQSFSVSFGQWRTGEAVEFSLFLQRKSGSEALPQLKIFDRDLIDGDIFIPSLYGAQRHIKQPLIDYLPPILANTFRIPSIILFTLFGLFICVGLIVSWSEWLRLKSWLRKYLSLFKSHLDTQENFHNDQKIVMLNRPDKVVDDVWKGFVGPRPPKNVTFTSWSQAIGLSLFMVFLTIMFLAGAAGLISY